MKKNIFYSAASTLGLAAALLMGPQARAVTYDFVNLTSLPGNSSGIQNQLHMDVTDAGNGNVLFTIRNAGPLQGSVFTIELDDSKGLLSGMQIVDQSGTVAFKADGNPPTVPGLIPSFDPTFAVTKVDGWTTAVKPGDSIGLQFSGVYSSVLSDLLDKDLRVALHAGNLADGNSQKLVNDGPQSVGDGGFTMALLGMSALSLNWFRRKQE